MTVIIAIGMNPRVEAATIPVAVVTCASCGNYDDLQGAADAYAIEWINQTPSGYVGTISLSSSELCTSGIGNATALLVVSTSIPISGTFYPCMRLLGNGRGSYLTVGTVNVTTDATAVAADNLLLSRAAANTGQIILPSTLPLIGGGDPIELIGQYLADTGLPMIGTPIYSLWHGILTLNISAVEQGTFLNLTTGQTFTLWSGDTITVTDQNGNTAKFQWNPDATPTWQYVEGSLRDAQGNPPAGTSGPTPPVGGTSQPQGPINVSLPTGPTFEITPWYDDQTPRGTVTVGDPYNTTLQCSDTTCDS